MVAVSNSLRQQNTLSNKLVYARKRKKHAFRMLNFCYFSKGNSILDPFLVNEHQLYNTQMFTSNFVIHLQIFEFFEHRKIRPCVHFENPYFTVIINSSINS